MNEQLEPKEQVEPKEARLLAAASYVLFLCFLPPLLIKENGFAMHHARQGFLLFFVEIVLSILVYIVEHSIGLIPILGFLIVVLLKFATGIAILLVVVIGIVKAISGQTWTIPFVGEYSSKVPF
ncbi:MAG: hypothetical protein NTX17_00260 [Candidatus Eisenbacteria bacterium]|nr:hypothetical protein [Candidatus Eisenbacteria bacterium]